jgi:SAM-dependent methyltransferase
MDETVVQRIMEDWRLVAWPVRPDAARVQLFRSALTGVRGALVLGATPELIDMLLTEKIGRIAAIDRHPETIEAMRRLASQDWSRVELVVGDWRDPRPDWDATFDLALCDGGLNFLPFPDGWRTVLAAIRGHLRPGGRLVTTMSSTAPTAGGFQDHYARAVARFESEQSGLAPEQQARRFVELAAQLRGITQFGAVDPEGRVRLDVAAAARRWIAEDLRGRYPAFQRVVDANFGRPNPVGGDGASIVAVPALKQVEAEMIRCGFDVEVLASIHRPPKHSFAIAATRSR